MLELFIWNFFQNDLFRIQFIFCEIKSREKLSNVSFVIFSDYRTSVHFLYLINMECFSVFKYFLSVFGTFLT